MTKKGLRAVARTGRKPTTENYIRNNIPRGASMR